eukprot:356701-Chlamydomonas_euryale.AAC.10
MSSMSRAWLAALMRGSGCDWRTTLSGAGGALTRACERVEPTEKSSKLTSMQVSLVLGESGAWAMTWPPLVARRLTSCTCGRRSWFDIAGYAVSVSTSAMVITLGCIRPRRVASMPSIACNERLHALSMDVRLGLNAPKHPKQPRGASVEARLELAWRMRLPSILHAARACIAISGKWCSPSASTSTTMTDVSSVTRLL